MRAELNASTDQVTVHVTKEINELKEQMALLLKTGFSRRKVRGELVELRSTVAAK